MTAKKAPAKRKRVDKEAVERDYRLGKFTMRELAAKYGCDHSMIGRWAKALGWTQDLNGAVKRATDARLLQEAAAKEEVTRHVNKVTKDVNNVLAAAEVNTQVILKQRDRVRRATDVAMRMLDELDATTTHADELEALLKQSGQALPEVQAADFERQARELLRLHNRVGSAQKLMAALKDAQALERQAFNLDAPAEEGAGTNKTLSDAERASRIAALLQRAAQRAVNPPPLQAPGNDARH